MLFSVSYLRDWSVGEACAINRGQSFNRLPHNILMVSVVPRTVPTVTKRRHPQLGKCMNGNKGRNSSFSVLGLHNTYSLLNSLRFSLRKSSSTTVSIATVTGVATSLVEVDWEVSIRIHTVPAAVWSPVLPPESVPVPCPGVGVTIRVSHGQDEEVVTTKKVFVRIS